MFCDVNLIGRVSKPAEQKENIHTCLAVGFSVAYQSTQKQDDGTYKSCFVNCICFGKTAERALEMLEKGVMVSVRGQLSIDSYQKNGAWENFTRIVVEKLLILTPKKNGYPAGAYQKTKAQANRLNQSENPYQSQKGGYDLNNYDTENDEVPF